MIKCLPMNQILALDNSLGIDMPSNKTKQNKIL